MNDALNRQNSVSETGLAAVQAFAKKGPPPLHLWNPPFCGDIDMEIRRDGTWFYLGTPIGRPAMVRLFGSILKREGEAYFLVTPVEKVGIRVQDAPFVAVDFESGAAGITFETNLGDKATAGPDNPLVMRAGAPYVEIRAGLEARVDRKSFYRLVELASPAQIAGEDWLALHSQGAVFPLIRMDAL